MTLAFGEIIRLVLINWTDFSGGAAGISSIPRVSFFGLPFTAGENGFAATFGLSFNAMHRLVFLYYLILVLALVTNLVTLRMRRLPLGRAWEALREDEIACRSLGIDTTITKLTAFALGAMFAGFAGSFFAVRQAFVSPGELQLPGERHHPGHRRARRYGQPDRRRHRRHRHDRRPRTPAQSRLPQGRVRRGVRPQRVPPAAVRPRHGGDDGVPPARSHLRANTPSVTIAERGR